MLNYEEFLHLKRFFQQFDWLPIQQILEKSRFSRRGRKTDFSATSLFRAFLLKSYLFIDDNTMLVKRFHENKAYLEFLASLKEDIPTNSCKYLYLSTMY